MFTELDGQIVKHTTGSLLPFDSITIDFLRRSVDEFSPRLILFHRLSQDFVWGAFFFLKKLSTFLVVVFKRWSKTTN